MKEHKQKISIHVVSTCSKPSTKSTHNVKIQTITDNNVAQYSYQSYTKCRIPINNHDTNIHINHIHNVTE